MKRTATLVLLMALAAGAAAQLPKEAPGYNPRNTNFEDPEPWKEAQDIQLPGYPKDDTLIEIYVSPVATNKYYVDGATLSPGNDGVVRYVLVVRTSGGATNVSFEGIRCGENTWKHYATGRNDQTWVKSQALRQDWRTIENKPLNPVHAVLSRTFFCPLGNPILTADEGRNALRLGKHPDGRN